MEMFSLLIPIGLLVGAASSMVLSKKELVLHLP